MASICLVHIQNHIRCFDLFQDGQELVHGLPAVFQQLNVMPEQQRGADIMRVRHAYLDGHGRHLRQTILFSSFPHAEINALLHQHCANVAGCASLRLTPQVSTSCHIDCQA